MDFLSHLFIPLTAAFAIQTDFFDEPWRFGVAGFGLLSDFDKFLGMPGLLHSLLTLVPICVAILAGEYLVRNELQVTPVVVAFILSHLVLDFVDGGPVPLLFPLVETGIGLQYPIRTVFGTGLVGVQFQEPLVHLRTTTPRSGFNQYGFIKGAGVASALLFATVYYGMNWSNGGAA